MFALALLCGSQSVFSQVDTAFWFAVPKLCDHAHWPITLVVTTFEESATVTITKPASSTPSVATFTVPANSSDVQVLVQNEAGLTGFECDHNATSDYGLYIHSTSKANAYVAVQQNNSEIYALKGNNGLGTHFFVTMQYQFDNGGGTGSGGYPQARNSCEVIATEDNTNVTIFSGNANNPTTNNYTLNSGEKLKFHFTNQTPIFIYATHTNPNTGQMGEAPVFVFQVTGAGKEFGGTQLPHVYCTGSTAVGYRPLQSAHNNEKTLYLTLLCNAAYTTGFQINGNANIIIGSDWHDIPGAPALKYCCKNVSSNYSPTPNNMIPFRVTNSLGKFHMGVFDINGNYDDCSISYFSSYTSGSSIKFASEITIHPSVEEILHDTICLGAGYFQNGFNFPSDSTLVSHTIVDTVVTQTVEFGCDSLLILHLKVRDSVFGEFSKKACNQYTWNGQTYRTSGDYQQTVTDIHGCDSLVTLHLEIEEPSVEIVTSGDDFCEFGELVLTAVSDYNQYRWNTGDTTRFISVTRPQTLYTVTVTQDGCQATDKYETPDCPLNLFIPSGISPSNPDGLNDYLYIPEYVHRFISYFDIEIYNRWGELVFKTNDMNFRWYGNIDGKGSGTKVCVSGVYVSIIHYERLGEQGKRYVKKGTVTVL